MVVVSQGYNNSKGVALEASFTPDSQFIMIGKSSPRHVMSDRSCQMYSHFFSVHYTVATATSV